MSSPLKSSNVKDRYVENRTSAIANSPDAKAMSALMVKLEKLKQSSWAPSTTNKFSSQPKSSSRSKSLSKQHPSVKNQKKKTSVKENDIRDYFKSIQKGNESSKNGNLKPLKVGETNRKPSKKRTLNSSYLRYGIRVPSFETIMKECEKTDKYAKSLKENKLEDYIEVCGCKNIAKVKKKEKILDCKHLTLKEIGKAVKRSLAHISRIQSGEVYSARHSAFCNWNQHDDFNINNDLRCDTSTIAFSDEQIRVMLKMLEKEFGDKIHYFLMVLLPELCLKIFMEVHNMSHDDAVHYLQERPDSDDSDSE